jgi:hypothetical protein
VARSEKERSGAFVIERFSASHVLHALPVNSSDSFLVALPLSSCTFLFSCAAQQAGGA